MTTTTATLRPVHLGLPLPEPVGAPGCGVCDALVAQRRAARLRGDMSRVTDCNVELRNHQRPPHVPQGQRGGDDDGGHGADDTDIEDGDGKGGSGSPGHCH
ncbi:hypothetical protein [Streptomyces fradiae]|uniref:hypothetical protein n=1 Tax=Streptomyces fradiae TaxID=1906 RepID=UPI002943DAAE|nr:hypothetical protein [Streptomyces fradiae]WOI59015.1 hypothetical protein RYQ63_03230 [Streptomyces fradiae]